MIYARKARTAIVLSVNSNQSTQSFACIWLHNGNQNEFHKHPEIKWLDGGHEPATFGFAGPLLYHLS